MASYLVHYVANQVGQNYEGLERVLQATNATQLTEELWFISTETDLQELTQDLFSERPPSDRFLIVEITSASVWSAANLMADPRTIFSTVAHRYITVPRLPSVKLFDPNQPVKELQASS